MTAEAYAQALWHTTTKGITPKKAVAGLNETLKQHGRTALMPRIAKAFERIARREEQRSDVVLSVAREKDAKAARKEAAKVVRELRLGSEDLHIQIDENLIGGWRLEGREQLIDASFKKNLLSMYNRATQSKSA